MSDLQVYQSRKSLDSTKDWGNCSTCGSPRVLGLVTEYGVNTKYLDDVFYYELYIFKKTQKLECLCDTQAGK